MSSGHVVMVLAGALGVALTLTVVRRASHTDDVLVAARDLAPGTVVDADSVGFTRVHAGGSVLANLFRADQLRSVRGWVVVAGVRGGELLTRSSVRPVDARAATRVMSFPIARARAVAGRLASGDRVDVVAVDHDHALAGYVVTDAQVVGVDAKGGGALSGPSDDVVVSLVVDGDSAPRLAAAVEAGTVELVRATGAPPLHDVVPFAPERSP